MRGRHDSPPIRMRGTGVTTRPTRRASTRVSRHIKARRRDLYKAFVDPEMVASWLPPGTMRCVVHEFEPRVGGRLRMSLTYANPADGSGGKTTADTDTFDGRFVELVPDKRVVWLVEFESDQPGISGEMRVLWELADADDGTEVTVTCDEIPEGICPKDNEEGSAASLEKLAQLMERSERGMRG
jgi:uncharacterized protein YndB with AHSA1/START domain